MENVIQNNRLIAEFMGFDGQHEEWCGNNILEMNGLGFEEMRLYRPESNWGDLMPVVEKIESLEIKVVEPEDESHDNREVECQFTVCIENEQCMIHVDFLPQYYGTDEDFFKTYDCRNRDNGVSKIQATYNAVIKFIKWHNLQNICKRFGATNTGNTSFVHTHNWVCKISR